MSLPIGSSESRRIAAAPPRGPRGRTASDLLRLPVLGALARRRHARLLLQVPLLLVAVAVVAHGLLGPQLAPRNLGTVLSWVHYRGLLLLAILALGNLFCTACPMILVRDAARKAVHPGWSWPRALRRKWPAVALFAAVLFAYELFDLWSLPRATAWLVLGYFGAALALDVLFRGAVFCKYVCPVGQFSFLASALSPTELRVRDVRTCHTCGTVDCLKGRHEGPPEGQGRRVALPVVDDAAATAPSSAGPRLLQRGCELDLFLPSKVGNLDCTLCFDCVKACPHDNIALAVRVPGDELIAVERWRAGIGRLSRRFDFGALVVVFVFGALLNAFAMTEPAYRAERWIAERSGAATETLPLLALFAVGLVVVPALLLFGAAAASRSLAVRGKPLPGRGEPLRTTALRYVYSLLPLGIGVWLAHYSFHLLTGLLTAVPVTQSAAIDLVGRPLLGEPRWTWVGMPPGAVLPIQLGCVLLGGLGSAATAHRIATRSGEAARGAAWPWIALAVALGALAAWILGLPMEMRGVSMPG